MFSLLLLAFFKAFSNSRYTIYFYNPEININNFASLKSEFDKYLSDYGPFQFQPFSDRETFEKFIIGKSDGVFLLSSWHYRYLKKKCPIESVLVGVSRGKSTHRKVLLTRADITSIDLLKGNIVATSGSEDYTKDILMQMLGKEGSSIVDSLKILTVPKDIDALMAVGFGMANFALATDNSFAKLMTINPKLHETQKQLAVSKETLLPIIAVPKQSDDNNIRLLLATIERMGTIPEGRKRLRIIGLDGWKRLDVTERILLE